MDANKKLLYIWEYGSGLGHISVFLPSAEKLRREGWEVKFYVPKLGVSNNDNLDILTTKGFEFEHVPGALYRRSKNITMQSHADLLLAIDSFHNDNVMSFYIEAWKLVLEFEKPNIVVCDFAILPALIARLSGFRTLVIDAGYYYPSTKEHAVLPYKGVADFESGRAEDNVSVIAERVNRCFARFSINSDIRLLRDLYQSDELLITNFKELCSVTHEDSHFIGGYVQFFDHYNFIDVKWPSNNYKRPKVYCYLHLDQLAGASMFMVILQMTWVDFVIYSPAVSAGKIKAPQKNHVKLVGSPVILSKILPESNAIVCHGGVSLISQSLWEGIPLLVIPSHFEQQLNGWRIAEMGTGLCLAGGSENYQALHDGLTRILREPSFKLKARAFKLGRQPLDSESNVIIDAVNRIAAPQINNKKGSPRTKLITRDLDVIFLSYDEPNAEFHWQHLKSICPWAQRVHGVKGFDASHKAAAALARTERFILIDGDNQIDANFFDINVDVPISLSTSVWQWCSQNAVNGLVYAAGGIKIWPKNLVKKMRTHESCGSHDRALSLDFWDQPGYAIFKNCYSTTYINGSPAQAYRAGFREGVKYGLSIKAKPGNQLIRRIAIWASAGADVTNGEWSVLGAREGLLYAFEESAESHRINDYDALSTEWENLFNLQENALGIRLKNAFKAVEQLSIKIPIVEMDAFESKEFKCELAGKRCDWDVFELLDF